MNQSKTGSDSIANVIAPIMFVLSLAFLCLLATLIVVWVDIPRFKVISETVSLNTTDGQLNDPIATFAANLGSYIVIAVWLLGFAIVGEAVLQHIMQIRKHRPDNILKWRIQLLSICICPPLRLAAPSIEMRGRAWLPWIGWQVPGRKLFRILESVFSKPMLFFALLILPVLLVEFGLHSFVEHHLWLRLTMHICTGLIWCAFAVEFVVLFSVSDRKFAFVKKNWIDLAIILLPVILFLRSLRAMRLIKVAQLAKAQQLANLSRVYRVRAVAMKVFRALMVMEVFGRVLPVSLGKKLNRLKREYDEKMEDLEELQAEIAKVESQLEKQSDSRRKRTESETRVPTDSATEIEARQNANI